ncbi:MAG: DUF3999 domain-containing protein [Methylobacillus sp.]|jgi:hypothetical protein|nr:DUF3999 domain-containing protein [Methylobacillus sp.]
MQLPKIKLCSVALALLLPLAAQADTAANYAWAFPLDTSKPAGSYRIVLTPEILASLNPAAEQNDMVVINALGRSIPFGPLQPREPQMHEHTQKARLLPVPPANDGQEGSIKRNTDGSIIISSMNRDTGRSKQWLLDAGRSVSLREIEIDPDSVQQDFQAAFSVEASDDLQHWRDVDYASSYVSLTRMGNGDDQIEQLTINFNSANFARYYRLTLQDGSVEWNAGQAPSAMLSGDYKDEAADRVAHWQWLDVAVKPGSANGDYDYDLPAGVRLDAIKVQLPADSSAARVHVLVQGNTQLNQIATLDLVHSGNQNGEATTNFDAHTGAKMLRLHTDTALTQAPIVRAAWVPPQYIFMADGNAPYRLLAGSHAARRGDYPSFFDTGDYAEAIPGTRVAAAGEEALQAPRDPNTWTRPLLWAVLAGGALLVIGMAWSLLRQSRREENKDSAA